MDKLIVELINSSAADVQDDAINGLGDAELLLVGGGCAESTPY